MNKRFAKVIYYGSVPWTSDRDTRDFSVMAYRSHLRKGKKGVLEVTMNQVKVLCAKGKKEKLTIPGAMIIWAVDCTSSKTVAFFDAYSTPAVVHVIGSKQHGDIYRHILHKLGVGQRMAKAQEVKQTIVTQDRKRSQASKLAVPTPAHRGSAISATRQSPRMSLAPPPFPHQGHNDGNGDGHVEQQHDYEIMDTGKSAVLSELPICFEAKYVGSMKDLRQAVPSSLHESKTLQKIRTFLRQQSAKSSELKGNSVTLIAHQEGLRVLDTLTRSSFFHVAVELMVRVSTFTEGEMSVFMMVVRDECSDIETTWLYTCAQDQAEKLTKTLRVIKSLSMTAAHGDALSTFSSKPHVPSTSSPSSPYASIYTSAQSDVVISPELMSKSVSRNFLVHVKALRSGEFGKQHLALLTGEGGDENRPGEPIELETSVLSLYEDLPPSEKERVLEMCEPLLKISHPNVVNLFGVCFEMAPWLILFESAPFGSVSEILKSCAIKRIDVSVGTKLKLALQLASALKHVHSKRFVHLDVRAENCVIDKGGNLKLTNFVSAKPYDEGADHHVLRGRVKLSLRWLAPEIFTATPRIFSEKTDAWSYAITVWELFTCIVPYPTLNLKNVKAAVADGVRPAKPDEVPPHLWGLLEKCMAPKPEARPTFTTIVERADRVFEAEAKHLSGAASTSYLDAVSGSLWQEYNSLIEAAMQAHKVATVGKRKKQLDSWASGTVPTLENVGQVRNNPLFGRMDSIWSMDLDVQDQGHESKESAFDEDDDDDDDGDGDGETDSCSADSRRGEYMDNLGTEGYDSNSYREDYDEDSAEEDYYRGNDEQDDDEFAAVDGSTERWSRSGFHSHLASPNSAVTYAPQDVNNTTRNSYGKAMDFKRSAQGDTDAEGYSWCNEQSGFAGW